MAQSPLDIELADESATIRLGEDIALVLKRGDLVTLSGDLGSGKSTFARAVIRAIADDQALDVPSPTFTLVQAYDLRLPVAHLDLYRIGDSHEVDELGLDEALETGTALVEWPENAGRALPPVTIAIALSHTDGGGRLARISGNPEAMARIARTLAIRDFLATTNRASVSRRFLLGDASTRAYEVLRTPAADDLILMNAPAQPDGPPIRNGKPYSQIAHLAENVVPFVAIGRWLKANGFAAPDILDLDLDQGILVLEHLGSGGFLSVSGEPVELRYCAAIEALAELHRKPAPRVLLVDAERTHTVPDYDCDAMLIEVELLVDWYLAYRKGSAPNEAERASYVGLWSSAIDGLANAGKSLVLRDYHSPNIIWREDRTGIDRLGIVDFQDAMIGPAAYDVASLVQDARVTIPREMAARLLDHYVTLRSSDVGFDEAEFRRAYATMAAQRASKILGIFVRLDRRDGKPAYLKHLPRIERYVADALSHEALQPLRAWYERTGLVSPAP